MVYNWARSVTESGASILGRDWVQFWLVCFFMAGLAGAADPVARCRAAAIAELCDMGRGLFAESWGV